MTSVYSSTRDPSSKFTFREAVLKGLADDGGLFVPQEFPDFSSRWESMKKLSFQELAVEVLSPFVGDDVPLDALKDIVNRSYTRFRLDEVVKTVPVTRTGSKEIQVLELFHGPTFAFKDVALQFLGNMFEYFLKDESESITILGATSGDTGCAALEGVRGKANIEAFILFPTGRVSEIQQLQMVTIPDDNIHNVRVNGTFDDCQAIVKELFGNAEFRAKHRLAAVNSINWCRILVQTVYYVYSYLQCAGDDVTQPVVFTVPTGNFGNILAGYYAKKMGLPVHHLVVGTNQNDILARFFNTGEYHRKPVVSSISPSMDISVASNFERFLYDICDKDSKLITEMLTDFKATGKLTLAGKYLERAQSLMSGSSISESRCRDAMKQYLDSCDYLACPHSAIGLAASEDYFTRASDFSGKVISLATAHPGKFKPAVVGATGKDFAIPPELEQLRSLPTRYLTTDARAEDVADLLDARHLALRRSAPVRPFTIKVPGSSANLGPGYDVLGVAVDLYLTINASPAEKASVSFSGEGEASVKLDESNLVLSVAHKVLARFNATMPSLAIEMHNDIPFSRGLGSSSAAVIGGVLLANAAGSLGLHRQQILDLSVEFEGHPDNVSAGVQGGVIASCMVPSDPACGDPAAANRTHTNQFIRVPCSSQVSLVVVVPEFELSTAKAREILPKEYPVADVVYNMQRLAALVVALAIPTPLLFRQYMDDKLHQPQRATLVPGLTEALTCANDINGALGVSLSGAGPSIAALAFADHAKIGQRIEACFTAKDVKSKVYQLKVAEGASTTFA